MLFLNELHQVRLAAVVGEVARGRFEERSLILLVAHATLDSLACRFLHHRSEVYVSIALTLLQALAEALLAQRPLK